MALLTVQNISRIASVPTYSAVSASDTFLPGELVFMHIINAGGSPDTVVFTTPVGDLGSGLSIGNITASVDTAQQRMVGPFNPQFFADPTTGLCTVTHSFTTSVTAAVFRLSQP